MKKYISIFLVSIFIFNTYARALVINEILPNPTGDDAVGEWIEIYNNSNTYNDLSLFSINSIKLPNYLIKPKEIVILAKDPSNIKQNYPQVQNIILKTTLSLSNSGASLLLTDNSTNTMQNFTYNNSSEGKSHSLLNGSCEEIKFNTYSTLGIINENCPASINEKQPEKYSFDLLIESVNEFLVLKNLDSTDIDISEWLIENESGDNMKLSGIVKSNDKVSFKIPFKHEYLRLIDPSGNQKDLFLKSQEIKDIIPTIQTISNTVNNKAEVSLKLKIPKIYYL